MVKAGGMRGMAQLDAPEDIDQDESEEERKARVLAAYERGEEWAVEIMERVYGIRRRPLARPEPTNPIVTTKSVVVTTSLLSVTTKTNGVHSIVTTKPVLKVRRRKSKAGGDGPLLSPVERNRRWRVELRKNETRWNAWKDHRNQRYADRQKADATLLAETAALEEDYRAMLAEEARAGARD